jgi:CcmD family protein
VNQLPPTEAMPAAPLLISAYAFVMIVLFVYVFSVARRLSAVQQELNRLDASIKQGGRT